MPESHPRRLPPTKRWMAFVDGENLTIRAQEIAQEMNVNLKEKCHHARGVYVWPKNWHPILPTQYGFQREDLLPRGTRCHYYTSLTRAQEGQVDPTSDKLREMGFLPCIFRKQSTRKSKGVDISMATTLLGHAYRDSYDVAVLVAGDGDFKPLIEEVQHLGKEVLVAFFEHETESGLSPELRRVADGFGRLNGRFFPPKS